MSVLRHVAAVALVLAAIGPTSPILAAGTTTGRTWYVAAAGVPGSGGSCGSPDVAVGPENSAATAINDAISRAGPDDTVHLCWGTYSLGSPILVWGTGGDLTIEGDSSTSTTLDGGSSTPLLISGSPGRLTLRAIELRRGRSAQDGGAVYVGGPELLVDTVRFRANEVTSGSGGAIRANSVTVADSLFEDNSAGISGGAIRATSIRVSGSRFEENTAGMSGGAIVVTGSATVGDSVFVRNHVEGYGDASGGAIAAGISAFVHDSDFVDNHAWGFFTTSGGAIAAGEAVEVSGGSFVGNAVVAITSNGSARGGAIGARSVSAHATRFERNRVGAIMSRDGAVGGAIAASWLVTVDGGGFIANDAWAPAGGTIGAGGGAVALVPAPGQTSGMGIEITGGTFSGNGAGATGGPGSGGAILALAAGRLVVDGAVFTDNSAGSTVAAGGAIHAPLTPMTILRATFLRNRATGSSQGLGGAVAGDRVTTIADSTFTDDAASQGGGAIWQYGGSLEVGATEFSANTSGGEGGAILTSGALEVTGSTFFRNEAGANGGAIRAWMGGTAAIVNSTFVENRARYAGGAVRSETGLDVTHGTFVDNRAATGGTVALDGTLRARASLFVDGPCQAVAVEATGGTVADTLASGCPGATSVRGALNLRPLGWNGGPTRTVPLLPGSVAIDPTGGTSACAVPVDQRGLPRPVGLRCDAGAFESQVPPQRALSFGGPYTVSVGSSPSAPVRLTAIVSPATAGCVVRWTVRDATATVIGTGSGTSRQNGVVSSPTLFQLAPGTYTVAVAFVSGCGGTPDPDAVLQVSRGSATWGSSASGWYRALSSGARVDFREQVDASASFDRRTGITTTSTSVTLSWSVSAAWRLRSSFTATSTHESPEPSPFQRVACARQPDGPGSQGAGSGCAYWTGIGTLESWDAASRSWVGARAVWYRVKAYEGGNASVCGTTGRIRCTTVALDDWFGLVELRSDGPSGPAIEGPPVEPGVVRLASPTGTGSVSNAWPN